MPGISICEHLPKLASLAHRVAFIRSLVGSAGAHDAFQCQSGFEAKNLQSLGGRPAFGSVVAKLRGSTSDASPASVDLMQGRALVRNSARPGFLGPAYQAFRPDISHLFARELEPGMQDELARLGANHSVRGYPERNSLFSGCHGQGFAWSCFCHSEDTATQNPDRGTQSLRFGQDAANAISG